MNELPGITQLGTKVHSKTKEFDNPTEKPYQDVKKVMNELRAPVNLQKGKSSAFPSAKKHFKLTAGWTSDFTVMESRCNDQRYKAHREFFDKPVLIH